MVTDAANVGKKTRLRIIYDLDAALQLRRAGSVLMDGAVKDDAVREAMVLEQIDAIV